MLVFILIGGIAEGQTADTIRVNATSETNLDILESTEKVLFLQRKDGHGKASIVPENRKITVYLTHEPNRIRGEFTIQDEDNIEIKNQLIALDSITKVSVPRKRVFLRIFGGIEFTLAFLSVFTYAAPIGIVNAFPFVIGAVFILTTTRKYNLVNKHKVKVLMGNPQFSQQRVGMTGISQESIAQGQTTYQWYSSQNDWEISHLLSIHF
jgi:hypothetical protein